MRICTVAHLAVYLVYRWDLAGEPIPSFQRRRQWYDTYLLLGGDAHKPLSYDTQLKWTNEAFGRAGLDSIKKTHAGRAQGAKQAELDGVEEAQIRRAGRWNSDALSNCYLSHLPRSFVRSMAGFDSAKVGNYFVPRTMIAPPQQLLSLLWPWVDEWQTWFNTSHLREQLSYEHISLDDGPEDRGDLAAQGFLALLAELRIAFLQDSVFLRQEYSDHPLWKHSVFVRQEYQDFAEAVLRACSQEEEEPYELRIRSVVPDLATALANSRIEVVKIMQDWGYRTTRDTQEILQRLDDFCRRELTATTVVRFAPTAGDVEEQGHEAGQGLEPASTAAGLASAASAAQARPAPLYEMDRTIQSVPSLWREWTEGLAGQPSIQALEDAYKAAWRTKQREKTFYFRRKLIIDEIRWRASERVVRSEQEAVAQLEGFRQDKKYSLNKLGRWVEEQRRLRTTKGRVRAAGERNQVEAEQAERS